MGGCGDYLDVANHVIAMLAYRPLIVTQKAKEIVSKYQTGRKCEVSHPFCLPPPRQPIGGINSRRGRKIKIIAKGNQHLILGREIIDVSANEQIKETGQLLAIGYILHYYATHYLKNTSSLKEGLKMVEKDIDKNGLDVLLPHRAGNLARPRLQEIAFTLNRLRSLEIKG